MNQVTPHQASTLFTSHRWTKRVLHKVMFKIAPQLLIGLQKVLNQLMSGDHAITMAKGAVTWLMHDHHMTVTWLSYDCHMISAWPSHDLAKTSSIPCLDLLNLLVFIHNWKILNKWKVALKCLEFMNGDGIQLVFCVHPKHSLKQWAKVMWQPCDHITYEY